MEQHPTGIIAWFTRNPVAANLLMTLIIVAGVFSYAFMKKKGFPEFEASNIQIRMPYLGAAPEEVEEGVVVKIEEALEGIEGINKINSLAAEGFGSVTVEVANGYDLETVLNEIKINVDAISTFPNLTEKPTIKKLEFQRAAIWVSIYGDMDEKTRKSVTEKIKDELLSFDAINVAEIVGARNYEIGIEIPENTLRKYGLTLDTVSRAIRSGSVDLPGGTIKSDNGDILLRTKGQAYSVNDFSNLVLRTNADGTRLLLGDIATIKDGFEESNEYGRFNGKPSSSIQILTVADQNEIKIAETVRQYVDEKKADLPKGVNIDYWGDFSYYLQGRLNLMIDNMVAGALLVFIILTLFLRLKIAFWVILGIPVSFLGCLVLMSYGPFPETINLVSLFGFILVLGIVVDDAIIIGESIYSEVEEKGHSINNVINGTQKVATTATFGVLTTIAAFAPMLFVDGQGAAFLTAIAVVVVWCLAFSLIESKLILPAHIAQPGRKKNKEDGLLQRTIKHPISKLQNRIDRGLKNIINQHYRPLLAAAIRRRYTTLTLFFALLIVAFGALSSGNVRFIFFPDVPSDFIRVNMTMHSGTATKVRDAGLRQLEASLVAANASYIAQSGHSEGFLKHLAVYTQGESSGNMVVELTKSENRSIATADIEALWREQTGTIFGAKELKYISQTNAGGGSALSFKLSGNNNQQLERAAATLRQKLSEYEGIFDIQDTISRGSNEIQMNIKPEAQALGISLSDLGQQVRQAFYGAEAQRIQRGTDDVKVMVRYPEAERTSLSNLETMKIRTASGAEVPFGNVAEVVEGKGFSSIVRVDKNRAVTVSTSIDNKVVEPGAIIRDLEQNFMPEFSALYPEVVFSLEGASKEQKKSLQQMATAGIIGLFLIYALIAIPLKSYTQPLIIMSVIPFGAIGAIFGHLILGMSMSMFSIFGIVALTGVVVNDSLIMVDFINKARAAGLPVMGAITASGVKRFRAIMLTSLTTCFGLIPIITEKSLQAQFVKPMAVSLSFGILFATVITLFLIPALYRILADFKSKEALPDLEASLSQS